MTRSGMEAVELRDWLKNFTGGCPLDRKREASTLPTRHTLVEAEIYGEPAG